MYACGADVYANSTELAGLSTADYLLAGVEEEGGSGGLSVRTLCCHMELIVPLCLHHLNPDGANPPSSVSMKL